MSAIVTSPAGPRKRETAEAALNSLPEGWFTMHDVQWPGHLHETVDHVVVGPAGIFVITDKNWSGEISVDHGELRHNGHLRSTVIEHAIEAADAVVHAGPHISPGHVQPVLCFSGAQVTGRTSRVMACAAADVAGLLVTRPRLLTSKQVVQIVVELDSELTPKAGISHAEERAVDVHEPTSLRPPLMPTSAGGAAKALLALSFFVLMITQPGIAAGAAGEVGSWLGGLMG